MSYRASDYARDLLERSPELKLGARVVLLLAAERANKRTGETYTGEWLVRASGLHSSSVRRSLYELAEHGAIALRSRPGKATVIRFPVVVALSTPRADERVVSLDDPARERATPRALARDTPRPSAPRTYLQPSSYPAVVSGRCAERCACGGTGWEHVDDGSPRGYVKPCTRRLNDAPNGEAATA